MSNNARFMLKVLGLGVVLVLAVVYLTPSAVYAPVVWLLSPLKTAAATIYQNIQSHQDGWFRWTVLALLALAVHRLGRIAYHLINRNRVWSDMSYGKPYDYKSQQNFGETIHERHMRSIGSGSIPFKPMKPAGNQGRTDLGPSGFMNQD